MSAFDPLRPLGHFLAFFLLMTLEEGHQLMHRVDLVEADSEEIAFSPFHHTAGGVEAHQCDHNVAVYRKVEWRIDADTALRNVDDPGPKDCSFVSDRAGAADLDARHARTRL